MAFGCTLFLGPFDRIWVVGGASCLGLCLFKLGYSLSDSFILELLEVETADIAAALVLLRQEVSQLWIKELVDNFVIGCPTFLNPQSEPLKLCFCACQLGVKLAVAQHRRLVRL